MDSINTTQTSLSNPTQPTPSKNQPPFVYFLIGTTIVILVAVVSFVIGKRVASPVVINTLEVSPSPLSPTPTFDSTADWKMYTNTQYGYTIKWPGEWKEAEYSSNFRYLVSFEAPDKSQIQISVLENKSITLDAYLKNQDEIDSTGWEGSPAKEIRETNGTATGGFAAIERKEDWLAAGFTTIVTYVLKGNYVYSFTILPYGNGEFSTQEATKLYRQILSTFTFIDQYNPATNWKTYTYQGISFKYPADWSKITRGGLPSIITEFISSSQSEFSFFTMPEGLGLECQKEVSSKTIAIDGITATRSLLNGGPQEDGCEGTLIHETNWFNFTFNDVRYGVTYKYSQLNNLQEQTLFDRILSTFKFIDNNTSDNSCSGNLLFFENDVFTICHPTNMTGTNYYYSPVDRPSLRAVNTVLENSTQRILITTAFTGGWGGGYETQMFMLAGFPVTLLSAKDEHNKTSNLIAVINMEERTNQFPVAIDFQKKSDSADLNIQLFKEIVNSFRLK